KMSTSLIASKPSFSRIALAGMVPRHPLYIQLLPKSVQAVIGKTHRDTIPAKAILEKEGFEAINEVDIFDAGPILQATTSKVRSVAQTKPFKIRSLATDSDISGPPWHAANGKLDFRACIAMADTKDDSCVLSTSAANSLDLQTGDTVWLSPARPSLPTVSNA
ncbi:MAG: arginine N-succinyltransferase, partial [Verrucomicrobiota bacterium]